MHIIGDFRPLYSPNVQHLNTMIPPASSTDQNTLLRDSHTSTSHATHTVANTFSDVTQDKPGVHEAQNQQQQQEQKHNVPNDSSCVPSLSCADAAAAIRTCTERNNIVAEDDDHNDAHASHNRFVPTLHKGNHPTAKTNVRRSTCSGVTSHTRASATVAEHTHGEGDIKKDQDKECHAHSVNPCENVHAYTAPHSQCPSTKPHPLPSRSRVPSPCAHVFTVHMDHDDGGPDMRAACTRLRAALMLRERYRRIARAQPTSTEDAQPAGSSTSVTHNLRACPGADLLTRTRITNRDASHAVHTEDDTCATTTTHVSCTTDAPRASLHALSNVTNAPAMAHNASKYESVIHGANSTTGASAADTRIPPSSDPSSYLYSSSVGTRIDDNNANAKNNAKTKCVIPGLRLLHGVFVCDAVHSPVLPWEVYRADVRKLIACTQSPACRAACGNRLRVLEETFHLFQVCNGDDADNEDESAAAATRCQTEHANHSDSPQRAPCACAAECYAVDNHLELSHMMSATALVQYMRREIRRGGDSVAYVMRRDASARIGGVAAARRRGVGRRTNVVQRRRTVQNALHAFTGEPSAVVRRSAGADESQYSYDENDEEEDESDRESEEDEEMWQRHTLAELCAALNVTYAAQDVQVDSLGLRPSPHGPPRRYDLFDPCANTGGVRAAALLRVFLTRARYNRGNYLADLVRQSLAAPDGDDDDDTLDEERHDKEEEEEEEDVATRRYNRHSRTKQGTRAHTAPTRVGPLAPPSRMCPPPPRLTHRREVVVELTGERIDEWVRLARWVHRLGLCNAAMRDTRWIIALRPPRHGRTTPSFSTPAAAAAAAAMTSSAAAANADPQWRRQSYAGVGWLAGLLRRPASAPARVDWPHYIKHIFLPLLLATVYPNVHPHHEVARLLRHVGGFVLLLDEDECDDGESESDCASESEKEVDDDTDNKDERGAGRRRTAKAPVRGGGGGGGCCDALYHIWANLCTLNALRRQQYEQRQSGSSIITTSSSSNSSSANTTRETKEAKHDSRHDGTPLQLRLCVDRKADCGTAGAGHFSPHEGRHNRIYHSPYHGSHSYSPYASDDGSRRSSRCAHRMLAAAYLLCDVLLVRGGGFTREPVWQFLYGMHGIGVTLSPMRDSALGQMHYMDHPFPRLLRMGLRVSLSTTSPLLSHYAEHDALAEEYRTAQTMYRLSRADMREVAQNSWSMSSWATATATAAAEEEGRGRMSSSAPRWQLRQDMWFAEWELLRRSCAQAQNTAMHAWNRKGAADARTHDADTPLSSLSSRSTPTHIYASHANCINNNDSNANSNRNNNNSARKFALAETRSRHSRSTRYANGKLVTNSAVSASHTRRGSSLSLTPSSVPSRQGASSAVVDQTRKSSAPVHEGHTDDAYKKQHGIPELDSVKQHKTSSSASEAELLSELPPWMADAVSRQAERVRRRAPYEVTDPRTTFSRVLLVGPYDRPVSQHYSAAQRLHRALTLRERYASDGGDAGCVRHAEPQGSRSETRVDDRVVVGGGGTSASASAAVSATRTTGMLGAGGASFSSVWDEKEWDVKTVEGVMVSHEVHRIPRLPQGMCWYEDFRQDVQELRSIIADPAVRTFAEQRLRLLEHRFALHLAINRGCEHGNDGRCDGDQPDTHHQAIHSKHQHDYRNEYHDDDKDEQVKGQWSGVAANHARRGRGSNHVKKQDSHTSVAGDSAAVRRRRASMNHDFYQSTKVDNNVRMETGMTARRLLDFIIAKARNSGDDIVSHAHNKEPQTLRQLLRELHMSPDSLTVDQLHVQQVDSTWRRGGGGGGGGGGGSSSSIAPYTPEGRDALLTLLLKTNNQMGGRYFAELTKITFENLKSDRFTFTESRLTIYGAHGEEWRWLSTWFDTYGMAAVHNRWMIQIPRIYSSLRRQGRVRHFADYLEHIFAPLWTVSLHPNKEPRLFHFVNHITGFDCVGDERVPDLPLAATPPHAWTSEEEPPYNYYLYYVWANIYTLNAFRARRGWSRFTFRPSCGEQGGVDHLVGGFLLARSVNYGLQLRHEPVLQYLFYLAQIGITMSPLSNNSNTVPYLDNPFPLFFRRGLYVSLGTESPLIYHHTQEPLLEEYSIASKIWKLSANDLCEIARNSVRLSGFSDAFKQRHLGRCYHLSSSVSNDATRTHLSDTRVAYRFETYHNEVGFLEHVTGQSFPRAMHTLCDEARALQRPEPPHSPHGEPQDARSVTLVEPVAQDARLSLSSLALDASSSSSSALASSLSVVAAATASAPLRIIDADNDPDELAEMDTRRARMYTQLTTLQTTLAELQRQNRQLSERLTAERERDAEAARVRLTRRLTSPSPSPVAL